MHLFISDIIEYIEIKSGNKLKFKTYEEFLNHHATFEMIKEYYIDLLSINFTNEQNKRKKILNKIFNENYLKKCLKFI